MVTSPRPPGPGSDPGLALTFAASEQPGSATSGPQTVEPTLLADAGEGRTLAADDGPRSSPPPRLVAGAAIGRYILQARLGEGGMGVVWTAHDPELDRPVAIKLLTSPRGDSQARLLREAQAMAKLAHPNVVAVFDVGLHNGQVYVAMELVLGVTLRAWLDADPRRPWRTILEMFLQAGRGLAAAHAVGLVHRDFKPEPSRLLPKAPLPRNAVDLQQSGLLRGRWFAQEWSEVVRMAQSWPKIEARSCHTPSDHWRAITSGAVAALAEMQRIRAVERMQ